MSLSDPVRPGPGTALLVVVAVTLAAPATASADDDTGPPSVQQAPEAISPDDDPDPFNGAFAEWSGRAGPVVPADGSTGWLADIGFRNSFPMYAGDNRLSYQHGRWSEGDDSVAIHGIQATVGLHPFFLALLSEGLISHFLASLHLELGAGAQWAHHSDENVDSQWGATGSVGGGFDLPITDPNQGRGLWINAVYRYNWSRVEFDLDDPPSTSGHQIFIGLAWRSNGMIW